MQIHSGDCLQILKTLPDKSIQCCVTSPPYYGLRNYDADGQLGMEESPAEYVANLVAVFREVRRVLRDDGTVFLNLGDSYAGHGGYSGDHFPSNANSLSRHSQGQRLSGRFHKRGGLKNLLMIPARVAIALQDDGWTLRSDIIWHKPVPMPESVKDRPTRAHEHVFMLVQQQKYYYDAAAIATPSKAPTDDRSSRSKAGQKRTPTDSVNGIRAGSAVYETANARDVWKISTRPYQGWAETSHQVRVASDAPYDDKKRIMSPDCPLHGDHAVHVATDADDAHEGDLSSRIARNDDYLVQEQLGDSAPIVQHHGSETDGQNSDSLPRECSDSAKLHSNQTHKTGLSAVTSPACNVSAQTRGHTDDISMIHKFDDAARCIDANKNECDDNLSVQTAESNVHSCTCDYYITETVKKSHFAVMPVELAQRCILAGTSKHGCCSECGAPWERVVKRTAADGRSVTITAQSRYARDDAGHLSSDNRYEQVQTSSGVRASFKCANVLQNSDLGWQASCSCNAKVIPCMVLDPFGGAGTTGEAALTIGRDVTLIELNAEYVRMIESRLIPLAAIMQV